MKYVISKNFLWIGLLVLTMSSLPVQAFNTIDEQIDNYLDILDADNNKLKITMLERLQWSGLSDVRLYDEIEKRVLADYLATDLDRHGVRILAHQARALAYSGNYKYAATLDLISKNAVDKKVRKHTLKALAQLQIYIELHKLLTSSEFSVAGKSVEVANYMKMLSVDNYYVQRLAARAIFVERQQDPELLAMAASNLQAMHTRLGLGREAQDAAAWLCKAIGQSHSAEYGKLLSEIVEKTPYKKIKKHAQKYAFVAEPVSE